MRRVLPISFGLAVLAGAGSLILLLPRGTTPARRPSVEPVALPAGAFEPCDPEALLRKNGFVVETGEYRQIFEPYLRQDLPFFITVDSAFYTFQFLFEKCLKFVEFQNYVRLKRFVSAMHRAVAAGERPGLRELRDARRTCLAFLEVAARLLGQPVPSASGRERDVRREVERIQAAGPVSEGTLFERPVNYNRFKPDGFYVGMPSLERYYRAFCWLSTNLLRTSRPDETAAALVLSEAFERSPEARSLWKELDGDWGYFLGPIDDLTLPECAEVLKAMRRVPLSEATRADVEGFTAAVVVLRQPTIRSGLSGSPFPEQGMLVLGTRYLPDSELFMRTTAPFFPRLCNSGLEVVSLMGSDRGLDLLEAEPALRDRVSRAVREIRGRPVGPFYREMLDGFGLMVRGGRGPNPPFMETPAWKDKSVNTALASWALLRHSFALQAKLTDSLACASPPPSGFVEPFPEIFALLGKNAGKLVEILERPLGEEAGDELRREIGEMEKNVLPQVHALKRKDDAPPGLAVAVTHVEDFRNGGEDLRERLARFKTLMEAVEAEARAEREGKSLDLAEIRGYGKTLQGLHGYDLSDHDFDDDMPKVCVVCEYQIPERLLQVGIGRANRIYVLYPWQGNLVPCVGAVLSYREFTRPLSCKLDDAEWQAAAGPMTARPAWTASFTGKPLDPRVPARIAAEPDVRKRFLRD